MRDRFSAADWPLSRLQDPDLPALERLRGLMARLRDPETGCPWDLSQDFASIAPYTLEEAYEVLDAIEHGTPDELADELGDLLFQVIFHAQIAQDLGAFDMDTIAQGILDKMIRRHPHVFGDGSDGVANWEQQKAEERAAKPDTSALAGVALALPALTRAHKLQKRAARVGFDWPDADAVLAKVSEETKELVEARTRNAQAEIEEEYGDLLFTLVNLGRKLGLDSEAALRQANAKFESRFREMEQLADKDLEQLSIGALECLWQQVKRKDATPG